MCIGKVGWGVFQRWFITCCRACREGNQTRHSWITLVRRVETWHNNQKYTWNFGLVRIYTWYDPWKKFENWELKERLKMMHGIGYNSMVLILKGKSDDKWKRTIGKSDQREIGRGEKVAIVATARHLAESVYWVLTRKEWGRHPKRRCGLRPTTPQAL